MLGTDAYFIQEITLGTQDNDLRLETGAHSEGGMQQNVCMAYESVVRVGLSEDIQLRWKGSSRTRFYLGNKETPRQGIMK